MNNMELPVKREGSETSFLTINDMTVRLIFAKQDNARVAKLVRETLKKGYNRRAKAQ